MNVSVNIDVADNTEPYGKHVTTYRDWKVVFVEDMPLERGWGDVYVVFDPLSTFLRPDNKTFKSVKAAKQYIDRQIQGRTEAVPKTAEERRERFFTGDFDDYWSK